MFGERYRPPWQERRIPSRRGKRRAVLDVMPFLFPETADEGLIFRSMVKWSTSWPWLAHGRMLQQLIRRNDL